MISLIQRDDLSEFQKRLLIRYEPYLNWLDEESVEINYHSISTSNVEITDKKEWNTLGREIYDSERVNKHKRSVMSIINTLELSGFIAQHEYVPSLWFPTHLTSTELIDRKIRFIKSHAPDIDVHTFDGGFDIENQLEVFLENFIDYPFLLKYKNIDLFSKEEALIVKITHHLAVDFITQSEELLDRIEQNCRQLKLDYVIGI